MDINTPVKPHKSHPTSLQLCCNVFHHPTPPNLAKTTTPPPIILSCLNNTTRYYLNTKGNSSLPSKPSKPAISEANGLLRAPFLAVKSGLKYGLRDALAMNQVRPSGSGLSNIRSGLIDSEMA
jgi:hypothetical protein